MLIEKLDGTSPRLYMLVAPLVMRRSVLRQNNNSPFWTSRSHVWFVAREGENVLGFVPVEITDRGTKINNYYVSGDNVDVLSGLLNEVIRFSVGDLLPVRAVAHSRHASVFRRYGFSPIKEWKYYVKMECGSDE